MHRKNLMVLAGFFAIVGFLVLSKPAETSAAKRLFRGCHGCSGAVACCGNQHSCVGNCGGRLFGGGGLFGGRHCSGVSHCHGYDHCAGNRGGGLFSRMRNRCCGVNHCHGTCHGGYHHCSGSCHGGCGGTVVPVEGEYETESGAESSELAPVPDETT